MRMLKTKCQNAETDKNRNMKHSEQLLVQHQAAEKKYKILAVLDDYFHYLLQLLLRQKI